MKRRRFITSLAAVAAIPFIGDVVTAEGDPATCEELYVRINEGFIVGPDSTVTAARMLKWSPETTHVQHALGALLRFGESREAARRRLIAATWQRFQKTYKSGGVIMWRERPNIIFTSVGPSRCALWMRFHITDTLPIIPEGESVPYIK